MIERGRSLVAEQPPDLRKRYASFLYVLEREALPQLIHNLLISCTLVGQLARERSRAKAYAFPQTPLWKSGPCGAVPRCQGVATGQHSPGSRYARLQRRSVSAQRRGERVMSDGLSKLYHEL